MNFNLTMKDAKEISHSLRIAYEEAHSKPGTVQDIIDYFTTERNELAKLILFGWDEDVV